MAEDVSYSWWKDNEISYNIQAEKVEIVRDRTVESLHFCESELSPLQIWHVSFSLRVYHVYH